MNLLIEIFSEEIPGRMQREAEEKGAELLSKILGDNGLTFTNHGCHVSTRRLCLYAKDVPAQTDRMVEERRGPRLSAPDAALSGFLKSVGMTKDQLRQTGDYYYADIERKAKTTASMMPAIVHAFLDQMPWPKAMRWYNPATKDFTRSWIRPIRSIACMLDDQPVVFDVVGLDIKTGGTSYGHRFMAPGSITLNGYDHYGDQMKKAHVIVAFEGRRKMLQDQLTEAAAKQGLMVKADDGLIDEVTGLVDFPYAQLGVIPQQFMTLPSEVLSTSMRVHQKYFTLLNADGTMAPFFGVVTNVPATPVMIEGLERVLTARLSDAHFFYQADVKTSLSDLRAKCDGVVFHENTGSLGDKLCRLEQMMDPFEKTMGLTAEQRGHLKRAISLCKSDLFTQMVGEFPELQGVMGRLYATAQGEHPDVADAIEQHYQPLGPSRVIPTNPVSRMLALLDKMDALVGFLGTGVRPTGNKDPLAIRRTALGIIRLFEEWPGANVDQSPVNDGLLKYLFEASQKAYEKQGIALLLTTATDVIAFIETRYDVYKGTK